MDPRLRLHRARVEKSIDLSRITAVTALSPMVVRKIDEGRFEDLPGGLYARSYIKAFAEAVGVPVEAALQDIEELLPGAPDPLPGLREITGPSRLQAVARWIVASLPTPPSLPAIPAFPALPSLSSVRGRLAMGPIVRRVGAALVDAIILLAVGTLLVGSTALVCGVTVAALLADAGGALAAVYSIPVSVYFLLFEGVAGQTPGGVLCGYTKRRLSPLDDGAESLFEWGESRSARPTPSVTRDEADDSLEIYFESEAARLERASITTDR